MKEYKLFLLFCFLFFYLPVLFLFISNGSTNDESLNVLLEYFAETIDTVVSNHQTFQVTVLCGSISITGVGFASQKRIHKHELQKHLQ